MYDLKERVTKTKCFDERLISELSVSIETRILTSKTKCKKKFNQMVRTLKKSEWKNTSSEARLEGESNEGKMWVS